MKCNTLFRTPFQGDSVVLVVPRAEALGLFSVRPSGDGEMSKLPPPHRTGGATAKAGLLLISNQRK
jgi:hypothetical protein